MLLLLFFNHCWRVMVEKKEFNDPGVPIYTKVESTVKATQNVTKVKRKVEKKAIKEEKVKEKDDEGGESEKSDEENKDEVKVDQAADLTGLKKLEEVKEVPENSSDDLS